MASLMGSVGTFWTEMKDFLETWIWCSATPLRAKKNKDKFELD